MAFLSKQIYLPVIVIVLLILLNLNLSFAQSSGSCASEVHEDHGPSHAHRHCHHEIGHHRHDDHQQQHDRVMVWMKKLPEELTEEENLKLLGFGSDHHDHEHQDYSDLGLTGFGLWIHAIGCSLLVSLASFICLIILPLVLRQGKPSKAIVDSLAVFGVGAMLGDAFLRQLPHAFGAEHIHSQDHHIDHALEVHLGNSHSHSLRDLYVGLSILAGIVLFLLVEKVVRFVDDISGKVNSWSHGHHHHHHKNSKKLKDGNDAHDNLQDLSVNEKDGSISKISSNGEVLDKVPDDRLNGEKQSEAALLRKRSTTTGAREDKPNVDAANGSTFSVKSTVEKEPVQSPSTLVFGYLNLFSDGVHNFTDGMALRSAFLLYGSVGGWSRTLFLLAHELPQAIGDFGILVRSGFSVSTALFFNFLSALVALVGTALGFTAGGFIYIAVAGVLAEMNNGSSALKSTAIWITSLILGMFVAHLPFVYPLLNEIAFVTVLYPC